MDDGTDCIISGPVLTRRKVQRVQGEWDGLLDVGHDSTFLWEGHNGSGL